MGREGWSAEDAYRVLDDMNVDVKMSTVKTQINAGKKGLRGAPANLTDDQAKILRAKRAGDKVEVVKPPPEVIPKTPTPTPKVPPKPKETLQQKVARLADDVLNDDINIASIRSQYDDEVAELVEAKVRRLKRTRKVRPRPKPKLEEIEVTDELIDTLPDRIPPDYEKHGMSVVEVNIKQLPEARPEHVAKIYDPTADFDIDAIERYRRLYREGKEEAWGGVDRLPTVSVWEGRLVLDDGHHRMMAAILEGAEKLKVRVPKVIARKKVKVTGAPSFGEHKASALARWMGKEGFEFKDAKKAMRELGVEVKDSTLRTQLNAGRKGLRGAPAKLTDDQATYLRKIRGKEVKPVAKPVKVPKAKPEAPTAAKKPKHITFTGEQTEFTEKVWKEIGKDGIKTEQDAVKVGKLIREEVDRRTGKLTKQISELQEAAERSKKKYLGARDLWDERRKNRPAGASLQSIGPMPNNDDLLKITKRIKKLQKELDEGFAETVRDVLNEVRDMGKGNGLGINFMPGGHPNAKKVLKEQTRYLPKDFLKAIGKVKTPGGNPKKLTVLLDSSASARGSHNSGSTVRKIQLRKKGLGEKLGSATAKRTKVSETNALHEVTHAVQDSNDKVAKLERDFLKRRAKESHDEWVAAGRPQRTDKGKLTEIYQGSGEMGYEDKFTDHYIGRVYQHLDYGEVLTCAMEGIFHNQHGILRKADWDLVEFTLGVLAGA
jgi:ParB-like chromosome segregation protein Spo0J